MQVRLRAHPTDPTPKCRIGATSGPAKHRMTRKSRPGIAGCHVGRQRSGRRGCRREFRHRMTAAMLLAWAPCGPRRLRPSRYSAERRAGVRSPSACSAACLSCTAASRARASPKGSRTMNVRSQSGQVQRSSEVPMTSSIYLAVEGGLLRRRVCLRHEAQVASGLKRSRYASPVGTSHGALPRRMALRRPRASRKGSSRG